MPEKEIVDFFDAEKFKQQTKNMDDQTLIQLSLELIAYYIHHDGYSNLADCIAIYGNGRPLVRVWSDIRNTPNVLWQVDFLKFPIIEVTRNFYF